MYAIRNRNDPRIFFHYPPGHKKQMTHLEAFKPGALPRLFRLRSHAENALSNWSVGKQTSHYRGNKTIHVLTPMARNKADWAIIEVVLMPKILT